MDVTDWFRKAEKPDFRKLFHDREDDIRYVTMKLGGQPSKDRYRDALAYYGTGDPKYLLRHRPDGDRYFTYHRRFMYGEARIVDCGAYTGDTVRTLLGKYRGQASRIEIDAFEPDEANFRKLEKTAERLESDGVAIRPHMACAYDIGAPVRFLGGLGARSRIDRGSDVLVPSVRLEDVIRTGLPVSLLKVSTSGSELGVLAGARDMILSDRPYLAVAIRGPESLLDIPVYIMSVQPGYSWSIRSYSRVRPDFVLYGIPDTW